jgi:hypothetical protein
VNRLRKSRCFAARSVLQQKINDNKFTKACGRFEFCWGVVIQNASPKRVLPARIEV